MIIMNNKIILTADCSCDLPEELKERYQVKTLPVHLLLEDIEYIDNVEIFAEDLFKAYHERKVLPKTAAINSTEYYEVFKKWTDQGYDVVHVNIGSAISCGYQNAVIASQEFDNVYVIDSWNLSSGFGFIVIKAAECIAKGMSAKEVKEEAEKYREKVHSSFILDTLTFMQAGGRCSSVAAIGASLLNLKPCIEVDNTSGGMSAAKKYRGKLEKVLEKYVIEKLSDYENIDTSRIFITYSSLDDESIIDRLKEIIEGQMHFDEIVANRVCCNVATHCGPNTLGILFMTK